MPLVIVNVAPLFEQAPLLEKVTGLPEPPPLAATEKLVPKTALAGACVRDDDRLVGLPRVDRSR